MALPTPTWRWRAAAVTGLADGAQVTSTVPGEGTVTTGMVQATATKRPLWRSGPNGIGGQPAFQFDGVDDYLQTTAALTYGVNATWLIVHLPNTTSTISSPGYFPNQEIFWSSSGFGMYNGSVETKSTGQPTRGVAQVWAAQFDVGTSRFTRNGTQLATGSGGNTTGPGDVLLLGCSDTYASYPGLIAEIIGWDSTLSAVDLATADSYVQDTYGIPVADYVATSSVYARTSTDPAGPVDTVTAGIVRRVAALDSAGLVDLLQPTVVPVLLQQQTDSAGLIDGVTFTRAAGPVTTVARTIKVTLGAAPTVVAPASPYASAVQALSPLLYLRLGESSGVTAADSSGNARDGTYSATGATLGAASGLLDSNTAVTFTTAGSGSVTVPSDPAFNLQTGAGKSWSVVFRLRPDTAPAGTYPGVAVKGTTGTAAGGWGIYRNVTDGGLRLKRDGVEFGSNATDSVAVTTLGVWAHWAVTYDGAQVRWYRNGQLASATAYTTVSVPTNTAALTLNLMDAYGDHTLNEFSVHPTALTAMQVGRLVRAQTGTTGGANPVAGFSIPVQHLAYECSQAQLDQEMALVAAAGCRWVRFDVPAVQIEASQGVRNWTNMDRVVNSATSHGLSCLGILTTLPQWSASSWQVGPTTAAQRTAFTDFASAAVTRYASSIQYWEIWNEPNNPGFWTSPSITNYVALLQAAFPVVKAANSTVKVLTGGTAGGQASPNNTTSWYTALYSGGGKNYFDIMNVHPYVNGGTGPPISPTTGEMAIVGAIRSTMAANGDQTKPMWGTECGFPTSGANSTTEADQAVLIPSLFDEWEARTGTQNGPLFVYTLRDQLTQADREAYFGVVHDDFTQKPAYATTKSRIVAATT